MRKTTSEASKINQFMKNHLSVYLRKGMQLSLLLMLLTLVATSCARKFRFESSVVVPSAEGTVKIKKDKNKNYAVTVKTVNLVEPDKLIPPRNLYVVWMRTEYNGTKNVGQFKTSSGLLSKKLKASLNTVTPYKPIQVFITAENDGNISYPSPQNVLTTGIIRVK